MDFHGFRIRSHWDHVLTIQQVLFPLRVGLDSGVLVAIHRIEVLRVRIPHWAPQEQKEVWGRSSVNLDPLGYVLVAAALWVVLGIYWGYPK